MIEKQCTKCKKMVDFDSWDTVDKICYGCYEEEWGEKSPQDHSEDDAVGGLDE